MDGQIRLRWTSHQGTILSVFDALLSSESLVDVTLACEGQYLRAHRVILSACSPYFQELLNVDSNKHPILFLKDVKYNELKALIQYMYRGEVNILQDELSSLLAVAEALKIKGLADIEPSDDSITSETIILSEQRPRKKANKPNRPAPPAVPIASSGLQITRSLPQLQQGYTFPTTSQTSYSSSPPASGTKKPRTDTQSHKQQEVDPLLNVQVQHTTITPSKRKINYEMVGNQNKSTGYYDATHRSDAIDYAGEIMIIEEPETFVPRAVKVEEAIGGTSEMNLGEDEDEEFEDSAVSQSSFHDAWEMDGQNNVDPHISGTNNGELHSAIKYEGDGNGGIGPLPGGAEVKREKIRKRNNNNEKKYQCKACLRSYTCVGTLNRHMRYECGNAAPTFVCEICTSAFKHKHDLTKHLRNVRCFRRFNSDIEIQYC